MSNNNYECKSLPWDTDYFGISSARVNLKGIIDETGQKEILEFCKGFHFVTIFNIGNLKENNQWIGTKTSAFLSDVNVQFEKLLDDKITVNYEGFYIANNLKRNEQIIDIAKKSFKYSRFFNDTHLDQDKARNVYLHWTESAFNQENKYFVITQREERIIGYILFSIVEDTSIIELIAVDEELQGQSVGQKLILTLESFVHSIGIYRIKVGTQVNNTSAVKFYNLLGFKHVGCGSIYHLWIR